VIVSVLIVVPYPRVVLAGLVKEKETLETSLNAITAAVGEDKVEDSHIY
jgi:hypothetical protein